MAPKSLRTSECRAEREAKEYRQRKSQKGTPSVASIDKAKARGLTETDIRREVEKFRNYAEAKDWLNVQWDRTFDNWCMQCSRASESSPADNQRQSGRRQNLSRHPAVGSLAHDRPKPGWDARSKAGGKPAAPIRRGIAARRTEAA